MVNRSWDRSCPRPACRQPLYLKTGFRMAPLRTGPPSSHDSVVHFSLASYTQSRSRQNTETSPDSCQQSMFWSTGQVHLTPAGGTTEQHNKEIMLETKNDHVGEIMEKFVQDNDLDGIWNVMSEHPAYLRSFLQTNHTLLSGDGPLPAADRHFLAVTACARHSCVYLVEHHKIKLVAAGGDDSLITNGLSSASKKMQKLYELNKILAHRPWTLTEQHIVDIVQTTGGEDTNLSLSELVYAIVLMAHFHAKSSFVQSCVVMEDQKLASPPKSSSPVNIVPSYDCGHVNVLSEAVKLKRDTLVRRKSSTSSTSFPPFDCSGRRGSGTPDLKVVTLVETMEKLQKQHEEPTKEELVERYRMEQSSSCDYTNNGNVGAVEPDISQFIIDPDFQYIDFAKKMSKFSDLPPSPDYHEKFSGPKYDQTKKSPNGAYTTLRTQDYSWDDDGFSLLYRFYGDISDGLDDKFRIIYNLTYETMGKYTEVDTTLFRTAVWNYIQCLVGIRHDDYDYAQVNKLLHRSLKKYIKTASCYPEQCTKEDYQSIMKDFKESEKIHVMLLVSEAKFQSELLYAFKAISSYFTKS